MGYSTHMARFGICFTINNYTPETVLKCRGAVGQAGIKGICWGFEVGEQGTPHMQGYLQANQDKYNRLMRVIGTCHMEKQKGTSQEAMDYCKKDGDYHEYGEFISIEAPKKRQGKRNDLDALREAINRGESYEEICEAHFDTAATYSRFIKERVQARDSTKQQNSLRELYDSAALRPWQQALKDVVEETPCPRKIHWIWENQGNVGKSWMANYLGCIHGATILTAGKKVDMAYIYAQKPTKIVLFDLARTAESTGERSHYLDGVYSLAEDLKNGRVVSTKYESKTVFFPPPHVIFFANFEPDYSKWSQDRYFVTNI